jgi:N-methylhydantoinase A/oxoprolinase/acetone carboxylase beta subunit
MPGVSRVHERRLAELAQTLGFTTVVCSHQVSPLPRLVPRSQTTVVEAAVEQVLFRYLQQVMQVTWRADTTASDDVEWRVAGA